MKSMKKAISLLLALVMCLGMLPMSAFAADVPEHKHSQNGWQCVYTEPVTKTDCTHQHDETCGYAAPTEGAPCAHVHDEDCGYVEGVEGSCNHVHDELCGFVPANPGAPCAHECGEACTKVVTEGYWTCTAPVAEEVPAQVKAFLDAAAALPAPETVTKDNAEAVGVQVNAVLDLYEGLVDAGLDGREDVAQAMTTVYAVYEAVLAAEEIDDGTTFNDTYDCSAGVSKSAFQYADNMNQATYCNGIVTLNGSSEYDSGIPNIWATGGWGGATPATGYNWVNITNSSPNVATASYKTEGGKLIITFTPGKASGSTKISVGVDAKYYNDSLQATWNMNLNFDYTVTNNGGSGGGSSEPDVPSAPSNDEMSDIEVTVRCVKADGSINNSCYGMTRDLTAYPSNYTIGNVVKNPGTKYSSTAYPYMCTITLNNEAWKDTFASILRAQTGITTPHYVHSKTGTVTKDFYYDVGNSVWLYETPKTMSVYVTETNPNPNPTYTVTYTDGVETEEVFKDQTTTGLNEGTTTPAFATADKGTETLSDGTVQPKRDGYTFKGWSPALKSTVDPDMANANGEIIYTATWQKNPDAPTKAEAETALRGKYTVEVKCTNESRAHTMSAKNYVITAADITSITTDPYKNAAGQWEVEVSSTNDKFIDKFDAEANVNCVHDDKSGGFGIKLVWDGSAWTYDGTFTRTVETECHPTVDNGNGIEVTKTRTAINDDATKTTATVGDTITWSITVKNNSNVTKTVTLTELAGVTLSKTSVTLGAGKSETVTATYTVTGSETLANGKFYNTVRATTGGTGDKENPEVKDEGTTITPDKHTVTVNYVTDGGAKLGSITYTLADGEAYNHSVGSGTTAPTTGDADTKSPKTITGTDGKTYAYDPVLTTNPLTGTMGSTDVTITVVYSPDEKGTIGTDSDGDPTDTPDGIPDKYQVKVTFKVKNGKWNDESTGDVVKYVNKLTDGKFDVNGTAALGDIIPAVGNEPDQGFKAGNWDNVPTETTTITEDTTYTYTYVPDTTADDGIEVTKKLAAGQKPSASVGDEVKWDIVVKNNSAESKTVELTELLAGATLSESEFTLAAGEEKTVTATYKVTASDAGKELKNRVLVESTGEIPVVVPSDDTVKVIKITLVKTNRVEAIDSRTQVVHYTITMTNESVFPVYDLDLYRDALTATVTDPATGNQVNTATITFGSTAMVGDKAFTTQGGGSNVTFNDGSENVHQWMRVDDVMQPNEAVTLTYDVTIRNTGRTALKVIMNNTAYCGAWIEDQDAADEGGLVAQAEYTVEAPRFLSLANMFAYDGGASGGSNVGGGGSTSGGGDTTPPEGSDNNQTTGSGSSDAEIDFGIPDDIDDPNPNPNPDPNPDPVDPYEPVIPDEPTPVAPNPPEVEIDDERTPLASANGLNSVDHFAYIIGYDDDTVRPENKITRAEVATIFFRLMTDVYRAANWSTTNDFSDVAAGSWYNNAISTCAKAGLVNGYSDGTFKPDQSITRAEFATIAARFLDEEITGAGAEGFADIEGHWAETNILRAAEAGWVNGDNGRFRPDDYISRAEVMTIVNRMLNRVPDEDHLLPEMKTWSDNPKTAWYYEAVQEATNEHAYEWIDENVENWTELLTIRDWAALEKEWATAYSAGN